MASSRSPHLLFLLPMLHRGSIEYPNLLPRHLYPGVQKPPPPPPPPPPPTISPAQPPISAPPPPPTHKDKDVTKAVVATAASSFALSAIAFFAFYRCTARKKEVRPRENPFAKKSSRVERERPRGSPAHKGVIMDESGLDAIYWREFQREDPKRCPHCARVSDPSGAGRAGGEEGAGERDERRRRRVRDQEMPLIPPGSLNSSSAIFHQELAASNRSSTSSISTATPPPPPHARSSSSERTSSSAPPPPGVSNSVVPPPSPPLPQPPGRSTPAAAPPPPPPPAATATLNSVARPSPDVPPPPPPPPVLPLPPGARAPTPPPPPPPGPRAPPKGVPPPPGARAPPPPPPPRPPSGASKNAAAPPPPPPPLRGAGASSSSSRPPAPPGPGAGAGAPQKKLKPLHWDKVNPANADHSMVWDRITDGSLRFDEDIMEALFGTLVANRKPQNGAGSSNPASSASNAAATATQICLLDPRKSQNIAIVLRSLAVNRQEILDALLEGRGLSLETLEKLSRLAPTKEEESTVREFDGDPSKLADAESFLFHLLRAVPSPFTRIDAMLFKSNYGTEIAHLKRSLETLESACKELRTRGLFLKLLEAVLKAGNRMNAGTARGNAQAFNLTALCKLSDVKSTDGSTTLLHFVVEEVVRSEGKHCVVNRNYSLRRSGSSIRKGDDSSTAAARKEEREREYMKLGLPVVGGLSTEFASVKKAAGIDYDALIGTCSTLAGRVAEIKKFLSTCSISDGFVKEMRGFVEAADGEIMTVKGEQERILELVKRTTEYYQAGAAKDKSAPPLQLFVIVRDFLGMVDQACVDIARSLQQKKPPQVATASAKGTASPEGSAKGTAMPEGSDSARRIMARFPNLPPHFMSENSASDSSDEEG
uniref:Formin-like protein n=1 Tax=Ananas comosus var. bracteatus TaxID=296719 RepID=A0A6V7P7W5_ANACO|nr:unnamed protein product [Ananas comosus var. bracteatus]